MTALRDVIQAAYLSHPPGESWEDAVTRAVEQWFQHYVPREGSGIAVEAEPYDLLEQLRQHGRWGVREGSSHQLRANALCAEAAAERLRAELDYYKRSAAADVKICEELMDERDRALAALERRER